MIHRRWSPSPTEAPAVQPHGDALLAPEPPPPEPSTPAPPSAEPPAEPGPGQRTPEWFSSSLGPEAVPAESAAERVPPEPPPEPEGPPTTGAIAINTASYEQLRELGLSVTQAGRVLAHRERVGGFSSVEELEQVPGFPRAFLDELKHRLVV